MSSVELRKLKEGEDMTIPYYPLYRMRINKEWILCLDCDLKGDIEVGMMFFAGVLGSKLKLPPDMLEKISEVLKSIEG